MALGVLQGDELERVAATEEEELHGTGVAVYKR